MGIDKRDFERVVAKLREERDELRVKMHLATLEAKGEWQDLEEKWGHLEAHLGELKDNAVETGHEIGAGVEVVAEEIGAAYRRIRERLSES